MLVDFRRAFSTYFEVHTSILVNKNLIDIEFPESSIWHSLVIEKNPVPMDPEMGLARGWRGAVTGLVWGCHVGLSQGWRGAVTGLVWGCHGVGVGLSWG